MDFLVLFVIYFFTCGLCFGCYLLDCAPMRLAPLVYLKPLIVKIHGIILRVLPRPVKELGEFVYAYLFFERNAVFQIIYVLLVLAGHAVTFFDTLPFLYAKEPNVNHTLWLTVLFFLNCALFVVACYTDPGIITGENVASYGRLYKYDDVMYKPGSTCYTCGLERIPRSKHCAIYNKCIHKFDHYCAWTNNCVGGLNQRYFILFLVSVTAMVLNGLLMNARALINIVDFYQLWRMRYVDHNGEPQPMDFPALTQTLFMQYPRIVFMVASLSALFVVMMTFTAYHVFLILTNQTTNERYKKHNLKKENVELNQDSNYSQGVLCNILDTVFPLRKLKTSQDLRYRNKHTKSRSVNGVYNANLDSAKARYRKSCKF